MNNPRIEVFARRLAQTMRSFELSEDELIAEIIKVFRSDCAVFLCDCEMGASEQRVYERLLDFEQEITAFRSTLRTHMRKLEALIELSKPDAPEDA